jgi:O-antigen/teichoic acid export membrane protein
MTRSTESSKSNLIRGALGSGALGIVHRGLGLITAVLLARILGAEGYGYYAFALGVAGILAVPAQLGLPQLITRELAANHALERWSLMVGLRRRATVVAAISILVAIALGGILLANSGRIPAIDPMTFALALLLLPLMITMEIMSSLLRGLRRVVHAMWPGAAFKPLAVLALIAAVVVAGRSLSPPDAMAFNIVASVAAIGFLWVLLARYWPSETGGVDAEYRTRVWLRTRLPFTFLSAANVITQKTDIVMLGWLTTPSDVGVYHIVVQGAMLVSFGFTAMNAVLAPNIARLYVQRDMARLQRLLSISSLIILAIAVCVLGGLVIFGEFLIEAIFGAEFRHGYTALLILGTGQLINASVGSVGTFLSMTGHENDTLRAIAVAAVANVILNGLLIPLYGLAGAAIATMSATILWNAMMALSVHKRLGLVPGPIFIKQKAAV